MQPMNVRDKHGSLEQIGDRWRLVFKRRLPHPPARVWRAVVEPAHRDAWFPQRIEGDWHVGATLTFVSEYGDFEGHVLAYEPPTLVEFAWGTDSIRLEVRPDGDGTLLILSDTFDERGKAARDAAGWHMCLDALERDLSDAPKQATADGPFKELFAQYTARLGPEAATIGPPPKPAGTPER